MTTDRKPDEQATGQTRPAAATESRPDADTGQGLAGARQEHTATDRTSAQGLEEQARNHLFECDRNARYHTARRTFLDQCHRWMMIFVALSGSAAAVSVTEGSPLGGMLILLLPTLFGAISVGLRITDQARDHEVLAHKFYWIAATIRPECATADQVHQWRNAILAAYENEPDMYHALNAECYNAAAQALGKKTRQPVTVCRHWLRHWLRFTAEDFEPKYPTS